MDSTYHVNREWRELANQIVKSQQVVLVIGATDTGKSTFCRFLADYALASGLKVACVDADIGQSRIGPPTTVGMKSFAPDEQIGTENRVVFDGTAEHLYFVGDVSSSGHFLEILTGIRLMVDSARQTDADFVVIDTTGYIHDPPAVTLKQHKIELIRPNHLVCIGRSAALTQIAACYTEQEWLDIHYLRPDRNVRSKSSRVRSRYRKAQFDAYFSGSDVQNLCFGQIQGGRTPFFIGRPANEKELEILSQLTETEVRYAEWTHRTLCLIASTHLSKAARTHVKNYLSLTRVTVEVPAYFQRRLVGLIDMTGNTYAIGIIEAVDFQKRELSIRCPFSKVGDAAKQACAIQFGDYQLEASVKNP
ncbi:MAG: Clp1/GlmU family protein [Candidatus Poribacteria bacterium]|nr:Clp1/GlmU family protein [Candidatus Poribacteria bacterium]